MLNEIIEYMDVKPGGIYVDGTLGGAGHSYEIAKRMLPGGILVGIDQDEEAIKASAERLKEFKSSVKIVKNNFKNLKSIVEDLGIDVVDGILLDIGVSSHQIDQDERGFSYMQDGPLDMRMDRSNPTTAEELVNTLSHKELTHIIKEYGEERWADRIAKFICEERGRNRIKTTYQLVELIKKAIPAAARKEGGHPAKRTFQALRIAVNDELHVLEKAIMDCIDVLKPGGRVLIITFHSLEDRIVKTLFNELERPCICPTSIPVCMCGKEPKLKVITKKPVVAADEELEANTRSKSAKLRVAERVSSKRG